MMRFNKPKHAGGEPAYTADDGASAATPIGWTVLDAGGGVVRTDSPGLCSLDCSGGSQTLHVRAESETTVSLSLAGVDGLSLDVIADSGSCVRVIVDGVNRLERLSSTRACGALDAGAALNWQHDLKRAADVDGGLAGRPSVAIVPAGSGGHCEPKLTVDGMIMCSAGVHVESVDVTLGPPRMRGVADSMTYGRGPEFGSGIACMDADSLLAITEGATLRLDGATTPGSNPFRFDQQAGVAALIDVLHAVDDDGRIVRMAAYSLVASRATCERVRVDGSSTVYRRRGPLSPWKQIAVSEATPSCAG